MTIKVLVIQPDGRSEVREIEPTLDNMKAAIGGGWLEGVGESVESDWCAYADEEGRLKGMPVNESATLLARGLGWRGDFLVGPVAFMGQESRGEDGMVETDVPERVLVAAGAA